jgi:hypothetical protein
LLFCAPFTSGFTLAGVDAGFKALLACCNAMAISTQAGSNPDAIFLNFILLAAVCDGLF